MNHLSQKISGNFHILSLYGYVMVLLGTLGRLG